MSTLGLVTKFIRCAGSGPEVPLSSGAADTAAAAAAEALVVATASAAAWVVAGVGAAGCLTTRCKEMGVALEVSAPPAWLACPRGCTRKRTTIASGEANDAGTKKGP